jgi:hypothetical protein
MRIRRDTKITNLLVFMIAFIAVPQLIAQIDIAKVVARIVDTRAEGF